jgi:methylphosphotriester-DNA--protein-cysteine methyltransferase
VQRCPVCRASFKGSPVCHRCRADLSTLLRIERQAEQLARQAVQALAAGEKKKARELADEAYFLHATPFHLALARFLASVSPS